MARFQFKLDPLLRQRRLTEQGRQRDLATLERERIHIEDRLTSMQNQIHASQNDLADCLTGTVNAEAIRSQAAMSMQFDVLARKLALQLAEVYRRIDAARNILIDATKSRRALDLLKEQRLEAWKQELNRKEQLEADDLVSSRHRFRQGDLS